MLLQAEHAVLEVPEQPPVLYWPTAHAAHVEHEKPLVTEQLPTRYELAAQFWLLHALQNPRLVLYWLLEHWQFLKNAILSPTVSEANPLLDAALLIASKRWQNAHRKRERKKLRIRRCI